MCVQGDKGKGGKTMAKGAMNTNLSKPIKLCTRGGKRFRCYKNYATRQQELVAIMPPPGCTREARHLGVWQMQPDNKNY
jgi:hypothetical protein